MTISTIGASANNFQSVTSKQVCIVKGVQNSSEIIEMKGLILKAVREALKGSEVFRRNREGESSRPLRKNLSLAP